MKPIVLLVLVLALVLASGCTQKASTGDIGTRGSPAGDVQAKGNDSNTCANSEYSTILENDSWYAGWDKFIELDFASSQKLVQAIAGNGDSALDGIASLSCLEYLDLGATTRKEFRGIADISSLGNLVNLKMLDLQSTAVSDLSPLRNLTSLEELVILDTKVASLEPLSSMTRLKSLTFNLTNVSNLSPLSNLDSLEYIYMNRTQVTDISPLANLTGLKKVDLMYNDQIQQQDCLALRELLPNTNVCCPGIGCDTKFK